MVDIDYSDMGSYLISITKRLAALEVTAVELEDEINEEYQSIKKKALSFKQDQKELKEEVQELKTDIALLSGEVKNLIGQFKGIARRNSMERLKRKIDDWSPEDIATRKDLDRHIQKAKK